MISAMLPSPSIAQQRPAGAFWAAALGLWLVLAGPTPGRADPLDLRATDWRMSDWRALDGAGQHWFLVGFALAWSASGSSGTPARRAPDAAAVGDLHAALAAPGDGADSRVAAVLLVAALDNPPPTLDVTGQTWLDLDIRHRLALLHGFYAGTYAAALAASLTDNRNMERLDLAFAEARRLVRPKLALAPSLLFARLSDWLFYTNHRPLPLVETIGILAAQIKGS